MIIGIGVDLVKISRIEEALARHGDKFAERILAKKELLEFAGLKQKARFLAKRFAAKEAAAKAFGTGFRGGMEFTDIAVSHDSLSITHNELGKPLLNFHGKAKELLANLNATAHLSISDEIDAAIAFVIFESA